MKLNPPLKAMHPFGATLAQECVTLFMYDVRTLALETQAHVPTYARWLESADMAPGLRPAPSGPPDPAVAPAHRALDPQDAQPPVAPRGPSRRLPRRPHHLDPPRPGTGHHVAGQSGQRRSTTADHGGPTLARRPGVEAQVRLRPGLGRGLRREVGRRMVPAPPLRRAHGRSRWARSAISTASSAPRSATSTPAAWRPSSSTDPRMPSAVITTTRRTSAGRIPGWPRSSAAYTERYRIQSETLDR